MEPIEIRVLLWLVEGVEPTDERVAKEISFMVKEKKETVTLYEWLMYVCSVDPVTGKTYFDYELKKKFDKYDSNNSGTIEKGELKCLLNDMIIDLYGQYPPEKKDAINGTLNVLVEKWIKNMDDNKD